jgi:hypothetical protein
MASSVKTQSRAGLAAMGLHAARKERLNSRNNIGSQVEERNQVISVDHNPYISGPFVRIASILPNRHVLTEPSRIDVFHKFNDPAEVALLIIV